MVLWRACVADDVPDTDASALMFAAGSNKLGEVEALLNAGIDARTTNPEGETPLHTACIRGNPDIIRVLLEHGGDPNARATSPASLEMTPLTWCAYAGYTDAVRALVNGGAEVNLVVRDEAGGHLTALDIARKIGERGAETARVLEDVGARTWASLLEEHASSTEDWMSVPGVVLPAQASKEDL